MKKYFYLLLALPTVLFSQNNSEKVDYFVQFNTEQFAKKVTIKELFNHKAFKSFNKEDSDFNLSDFVSYMNQSKPVVIHGNFTDSIAFYQITFSLKDAKGLSNFIQKQVDKTNLETKDSIVDVIKNHAKYSVYSPKNSDYSLAWNSSNFVIYGLVESTFKTNNYAYTDYTAVDTAAVAYDDEVYYEDAPVEVIEIEEIDNNDNVVVEAAPVAAENWNEEAEQYSYDDEYYAKLDEEYRLEQLEARRIKQAQQEEQIALLFENEFTFPTSAKINMNSDISSWIDYQSVYGSLSSLKYLFRTFSPSQFTSSSNNVIKGMNVDFYFENNKARMEQTVEYSPSLANIMSKVVSRKPNKNIYNYFPKEAPLAYMTYHSSTEEVLKNYPEISEQILSSLPFEHKDAEIITDLVSTIIDEEATATLFDGDFSMFLHGMEKYDYTFKGTSYDANFNPVKEEKTITKTRPIFTMIMTSTHATMVDKLLNLGVRKNVLQKENNYFVMKEVPEVGQLIFLKEGDVFVITNGLSYLNNGSNSAFSKQVKRDLGKNYMYGNFDMQRFMKSMLINEDFGKETEKMLKLSNQFKNIEFKSPKKFNDNKMKIEMEMNSNFSDKNIVLQTLDLVDFLSN